jgi:hypothetical protein
MHDFILRECELGSRAALAEDDEWCGFGPLFDLQYAEYIARDQSEGGDDPVSVR